jgi:hypothetical protein
MNVWACFWKIYWQCFPTGGEKRTVSTERTKPISQPLQCPR